MHARTISLLVGLLLAALPLSHAWGLGTVNRTLQAAVTADSTCPATNCTVADVAAYTTATVQVVLTGAATITFQGSVDGTNFTNIECFSVADRNTSVTSATASGAWRCNIIGLTRMRAPISGCAGCTVTVTAGLVSAGLN